MKKEDIANLLETYMPKTIDIRKTLITLERSKRAIRELKNTYEECEEKLGVFKKYMKSSPRRGSTEM